MYITNVEELVEQLRPKLKEYLTMMVGEEARQKKFCCYVHDEDTPSMYYNPKTGDTTVHCFGCQATHDIFDACSHLEGLPSKGPDWVKNTLPHLADKLQIEVRMGEPSPADRARGKLFKLASDISNILANTTGHLKYLQERGWSDEHINIGQISLEELKSQLLDLGWTHTDLDTSLMLESTRNAYFGDDKVSFVVKDYRGRPVAFISRNLEDNGPKYINTPESLIYEKRKALMGINTALKEARSQGLYVVEGPGDLAACHAQGITNVVSICGTAFTADHLSQLKLLGIRKVYFALDWDDAGGKAIHRILKEELRFAPGVSCYVVSAPETGETDPSDLLFNTKDGQSFTSLKKIPAFEWVLDRIGDSKEPTEICEEMVPIIASEETAVRREMFIVILSKFTGITHQSIDQDVRNLRDGKLAERDRRVEAAAEKYVRNVHEDPANITALMAEHEGDVDYIEKEFKRDTIGINYQLSKYEALQEQRVRQAEAGVVGEFKMGWFTLFAEAMSGGGSWTDGVLIYLGGAENSGKTATCIGIGMDVALHDPDAIVVMHFTDDSFAQVEPRLKTNIALMTMAPDEPYLTIGMANNPTLRCETPEELESYHRADNRLRDLIAEEKLVIIDMEDGSTLSALERNLRHLRRRHPEKKIMVIADNTHNYMDYLQLDQPTRMTRISNMQKMLAGKYHCCMIATAEYRKLQGANNTSKMSIPTNDDLADARALKYRPNMIIHVYNDLSSRRDDAEVFWTSPRSQGERLPRLMLVVSKNKISKFKDKLMLDLDIDTVALRQTDTDRAREESVEFFEKKEAGEIKVQDGVVIEAEW